MIDWIKSWFGKGRVRAEWTGIDRSGKLVSGDAKAPYVGTWDEDAMIKYIKDELMYQHGVTVTKIQIVAHVE
jgi:hypothetical protein